MREIKWTGGELGAREERDDGDSTAEKEGEGGGGERGNERVIRRKREGEERV